MFYERILKILCPGIFLNVYLECVPVQYSKINLKVEIYFTSLRKYLNILHRVIQFNYSPGIFNNFCCISLIEILFFATAVSKAKSMSVTF